MLRDRLKKLLPKSAVRIHVPYSPEEVMERIGRNLDPYQSFRLFEAWQYPDEERSFAVQHVEWSILGMRSCIARGQVQPEGEGSLIIMNIGVAPSQWLLFALQQVMWMLFYVVGGGVFFILMPVGVVWALLHQNVLLGCIAALGVLSSILTMLSLPYVFLMIRFTTAKQKLLTRVKLLFREAVFASVH